MKKNIMVFDNLRQWDFAIVNQPRLIAVKAIVNDKNLPELERVGKLAREDADEFREMFQIKGGG